LPASPDENPNKKATPTAAEALPINAANAYLWLAIQVYQGLGQLIDLPGRIPQSLLDQLSQSASAVDRAAADQAAQQVLAAVQQAVTGQTAFPPWPQHQPDVAAYAAQIEQALAAGQLLKMRYYSAGRDLLTTRRVEPYRLEQHGDTLYVIGFCHRVQAERMFRLDRIEALTSVSPDEHDYAPPTT
ncbi:MAG TPA: WYL domain-containing protein, partial [Anaerolineae bacterium]|nr:WYL domain-containing protein [Anaerolineae bacterium]